MADYSSFFIPKKSETTQQKVASALGVSTSQISSNVNTTNQTPSGISSTIRSSGGGGTRSSVGSSSGSQGVQSVQSVQVVDSQKVYDSSGGVVGINNQQTSVVGLSNTGVKQIKEEPNIVQQGVITGLTGVINVQPFFPISMNAETGRTDFDLGKLFGFRDLSKTVLDIPKAGESVTRRMSPQERDVVTTLGISGGTFVGAGLAPAVLGTGLIGTLVGGTLKATGVTALSVPTAKAIAEPFTQSPLSYEDRIKFSRLQEAKTIEKIGAEGLNIPFLDKPTEKFLTGNFIGQAAYELPFGKMGALINTVQSYKSVLLEAGYSKQQAEDIAAKETIRESIAGSFGEVPGFVVANQTIGELSGSATQKGIAILTGAENVVMSPLKSRAYGAVAGAIGGGVGGFVETAVGYPLFQAGRNREVTSEGYNNALIWGTTTATGAGFFIGALTGTGAIQKIGYGAVSSLEAFQEYGGDWGKTLIKNNEVFDVFLNIAGQSTKQINTTAASSIGVALSNTGDGVKSTLPASWTGGIYGGKGSGSNNASQFFFPNSTDTFGIDLVNKGGVQTISKTEQNNINETNAITKQFTDDLIITDTGKGKGDSITNSITNTDTQTNTNTFTFANTYTPTFTPVITAPFIPLGGGFGLGDGGSRGSVAGARTRRKYYDELGAALGILNRQTPQYVQKQNRSNNFQRKKVLQQELKQLNKRQSNSKQVFKPSKAMWRGFL